MCVSQQTVTGGETIPRALYAQREWLLGAPDRVLIFQGGTAGTNKRVSYSPHTPSSCLLGPRDSSRIICLQAGAVGMTSLGGDKGQYAW